MTNDKNDMVRVNTRISRTTNEWLDKESRKTGLSKSQLIMLAAEGYRKEREVIEGMVDMSDIYSKLQTLEKAVKRNDPN